MLSKLKSRLICAIKGFLIEHTLFPVAFRYKGNDLLEELVTR